MVQCGMTKFRNTYRVQSTRLANWDYTSAGYYFVTLCTRNRLCFFGDVVDGAMALSPIGATVAGEWQKTSQIRAYVALDEWVVMPNHLHGILVINEHAGSTPQSRDDTAMPLAQQPETPRSKGAVAKPHALGTIISQFKSVCTKRSWTEGHSDFGWQANYYDHVIRTQTSLDHIRAYIRDNPLRWDIDRDNAAQLYM
jgi:putative transposase